MEQVDSPDRAKSQLGIILYHDVPQGVTAGKTVIKKIDLRFFQVSLGKRALERIRHKQSDDPQKIGGPTAR